MYKNNKKLSISNISQENINAIEITSKESKISKNEALNILIEKGFNSYFNKKNTLEGKEKLKTEDIIKINEEEVKKNNKTKRIKVKITRKESNSLSTIMLIMSIVGSLIGAIYIVYMK